MYFGQPEFLYGLLLLPVIFLIWQWSAARRRAAIARLGDPALVRRLSASVNWEGRRWQAFLWFLALFFLIIALARPQWGSEVQVVEQRGIEIMIALDISQSMMAEDIKPNRLSRAKLTIVDLMKRLEGNEMGLVLFAGDSFIQFPLTFDFATARSFLDNARPGIISRPGTAIGDAIETAMKGFNEQLASQKVIVIMTDGENHEPDALEWARRAAEEGIIIYTVGFGSPNGEPIPRYNEQNVLIGFKKDQDGQTILSKLDEVTLQKIAFETKGQYFRSTASGREIDALIAEVKKLETTQLESRFETRRVERFQGFLLVALVALIVHELIPDRVKKAALRGLMVASRGQS
jgi:Ca-activated chloride channel family protein